MSAILTGVANPTDKTLAKLVRATAALDACRGAHAARCAKLIAYARAECERRGLREFARSIGVDPANLTKALAGHRRLSLQMLAKLEQAFPLKP